MASLTEQEKKNGVLTFKFRACLGRDKNGKQVFRATTWEPPEGMTQAKARKKAEAEAERWETGSKASRKRTKRDIHHASACFNPTANA